ncbi:MAG: hypothetical protein WC683_17160 [bacterium]
MPLHPLDIDLPKVVKDFIEKLPTDKGLPEDVGAQVKFAQEVDRLFRDAMAKVTPSDDRILGVDKIGDQVINDPEHGMEAKLQQYKLADDAMKPTLLEKLGFIVAYGKSMGPEFKVSLRELPTSLFDAVKPIEAKPLISQELLRLLGEGIPYFDANKGSADQLESLATKIREAMKGKDFKDIPSYHVTGVTVKDGKATGVTIERGKAEAPALLVLLMGAQNDPARRLAVHHIWQQTLAKAPDMNPLQMQEAAVNIAMQLRQMNSPEIALQVVDSVDKKSGTVTMHQDHEELIGLSPKLLRRNGVKSDDIAVALVEHQKENMDAWRAKNPGATVDKEREIAKKYSAYADKMLSEGINFDKMTKDQIKNLAVTNATNYFNYIATGEFDKNGDPIMVPRSGGGDGFGGGGNATMAVISTGVNPVTGAEEPKAYFQLGSAGLYGGGIFGTGVPEDDGAYVSLGVNFKFKYQKPGSKWGVGGEFGGKGVTNPRWYVLDGGPIGMDDGYHGVALDPYDGANGSDFNLSLSRLNVAPFYAFTDSAKLALRFGIISHSPYDASALGFNSFDLPNSGQPISPGVTSSGIGFAPELTLGSYDVKAYNHDPYSEDHKAVQIMFSPYVSGDPFSFGTSGVTAFQGVSYGASLLCTIDIGGLVAAKSTDWVFTFDGNVGGSRDGKFKFKDDEIKLGTLAWHLGGSLYASLHEHFNVGVGGSYGQKAMQGWEGPMRIGRLGLTLSAPFRGLGEKKNMAVTVNAAVSGSWASRGKQIGDSSVEGDQGDAASVDPEDCEPDLPCNEGPVNDYTESDNPSNRLVADLMRIGPGQTTAFVLNPVWSIDTSKNTVLDLEAAIGVFRHEAPQDKDQNGLGFFIGGGATLHLR